MDDLKRGDVVRFAFAQPGNDTTYLLLTEVRAEDADGWDLMFDVEVKNVDLSRLWLASESEMASRTTLSTTRRSGSFSVQELADEARQEVGFRKERQMNDLIERLRSALADIAFSSDMTLAVARKKAARVYRETAAESAPVASSDLIE